MTRHEILRRWPNATESLIRANLSTGDSGPAAKPELPPGHAPDEDRKAEKKDPRRFLVTIVDVRKRLLDEDNAVGKWHVDLLRYSGVIPGDAPGQCSIQKTQRKATKGEVERVIIEVFVL